jgi:hypothetical protein
MRYAFDLCTRREGARGFTLPRMTSNSTPMAGSGVRMSEKKMTPSGWKARHGCSESSMAISGVSDLSRNGITSENLPDHTRRTEDVPGQRMQHYGFASPLVAPR